MKALLPLLTTVLFFITAKAQNYQCLQSGVKHYFINGNGYLRGIRIDTVMYIGSDSVFYPFRTPRGGYDATTLPSLTYRGSWLGEKVIQQNDGTFIFDSYWGDSVIIKTQANIGDSWMFYSDSGSVYYQAAVVSTDTMTVLSLLDSIKTIRINAYNSSGHLASDPLDSFNIILSKNNGFVQIFDLYTFPYHEPDSVYRLGLDFFLDRSTLTTNTINDYAGNPPDEHITVFKLIDFIIPNNQQLFNWSVGDIFHGEHRYSTVPLVTNTIKFMDTVATKVISGTACIDSIVGTKITCSSIFPCSLICNRGVYTFYDNAYHIVPPSYLPEDRITYDFFLFYYPEDTSFCMNSPGYTRIDYTYPNNALDRRGASEMFKLGIGLIYFDYYSITDLIWEWDILRYCRINGIECGTPYPTPIDSSASIKHSTTQNNYKIFPIPATEILTIKATSVAPYNITLSNMLGQAAITLHATNQQETINTSHLPAGIYNVSITDDDGNRYNEKVTIMH